MNYLIKNIHILGKILFTIVVINIVIFFLLIAVIIDFFRSKMP